MEVHFTPELQARLDQMARESDCPSEQVVESAVKCYLDGLERVRQVLDSRYDDLESGRVKPSDGEAFFESLRAREDELLKKPALG